MWDFIRWIAFAPFALLFAWMFWANCYATTIESWGNEGTSGSVIPLVGGLSGAAAILVMPLEGAWRYCWIPLVAELVPIVCLMLSSALSDLHDWIFGKEEIGHLTKPESEQELVPLRVPWMVCPSTPFLRLSEYEDDSDKPPEVTFVGYFKLEEFTSEANVAGTGAPLAGSGLSTAVLVASNPYEFSLDAERSGKPYQMVRLVFEHALWARLSPGYSDGRVLDPLEFDDSRLSSTMPFESDDGDDIDAYLAAKLAQWRRTKICPDPGAYVVKRSMLIAAIGEASPSFKHYIVTGHDDYVEVIAKDMKWESLGALVGW